MERQYISEDQLLSQLNEELHKYEECSNCEFTSVQKLRDFDENGCNWSSVNVRCSGVSSEICSPFAARIVTEAKANFNIKKN